MLMEKSKYGSTPDVTCDEEEVSLLRQKTNNLYSKSWMAGYRNYLAVLTVMFAVFGAYSLSSSNGASDELMISGVTRDEEITIKSVSDTIIGIPLETNQIVLTPEMLGDGFKLNTEEDEGPFRARVLNGVREWGSPLQAIIKSEVITDASSLQESNNLKGSVGGVYGPFSGRLSIETVSSKMTTANTVTIAYKNQQKYKSYSLKYREGQERLDLTSAANAYYQNGLLDPKEEEKFWDMFGTKFVKRLVYGGELHINYEITSDNVIDENQVKADLRIGFQGAVDVGFSSDFYKKYSSGSTTLSAVVKSVPSTLEINVPFIPTMQDLEDAVTNFTNGYNDLIKDISDEDITDKLSVVGFVLQDIQKNLDKIPSINVARLQMKMSDIASESAKVLYEWQHLKMMRKSLDEMWRKSGKDYAQFFSPWDIAQLPYKKMLEDKMKEYYNYRGNNITDIVDDIVMKPDPIAVKDYIMIRGLCGYGFVSPFVDDDNKTYNKLDYEGFTLPSKEGTKKQTTFYKGKAFCTDSDSDNKAIMVDTTYVKNFAREIAKLPPNYCIQTDSPSAAPSAAPSAYFGCSSPRTRVRPYQFCNSRQCNDGGGKHEISIYVNDRKVFPKNSGDASSDRGCIDINAHDTWMKPNQQFKLTVREHDYIYHDDYVSYKKDWCNGNNFEIKSENCYTTKFTYDK